MDHARLNTILNALKDLPLEDYHMVFLMLRNRLEPHLPVVLDTIAVAEKATREGLVGVGMKSDFR